MQLDNKVAVVTGAGRGIGRAIAIGFAQAGAAIIAVSRTAKEIEETAAEAARFGRRAIAIRADVSQAEDVRRLADEIASCVGRVDVLVNNAALRMNHLGAKDSYTIPFTDISIADWDRTIAVNLRGPFLCIKMLLPLMRGGSIINISAGGGKKGMPGRSPYCASKFGLEGLTQCLASEFSGLGIAVNSLSPGSQSILTDEAKRERLKKNPALLYMKPEMMVPPALFLALQDGHGATGRHIEALEWLAQNNLGGEQEWRVKL